MKKLLKVYYFLMYLCLAQACNRQTEVVQTSSPSQISLERLDSQGDTAVKVLKTAFTPKDTIQKIVNGDTLVWYHGGYVVKNQKIVLLNPNGNSYKKYGRNDALNLVINNIKNRFRITNVEIIDSTAACFNLYLLRGYGLHLVDTTPDPDGSSTGNNVATDIDVNSKSSFQSIKKNTLPNNPLLKPMRVQSNNSCCIDAPVRLAILDTGIESRLLRVLKNKFKRVDTLNFANGLNHCPSRYINDNDDIFHGTQVARIITSDLLNNSDTKVELMIFKIMDKDGGNLFDALTAMLYANKIGADLINCSWGHGGEKKSCI